MTIIGILVAVLIIGVVWWCTTQLIRAFAIPDPLSTIIQVVVILICLIFFLNQFGVVNLRIS